MQIVGSGFQTVIDSGTTIMYGPPAAVAAFYKNVPGAALYDSANGFYSFPCNSSVQVALNFSDEIYAIDPADFNVGEVYGNPGCVATPLTV